MKKRLNIGIENFKKLIDGNYYYVDQTDMIRELLSEGDAVSLITRPRRFGKTLGLSMLRCFFEINTDDKNEKLFDGLKITEYSHYRDHIGKYPVIHISFKGTKQLTLENSLLQIYKIIASEYIRHIEAVKSYGYFESQIEAILNCTEESRIYNDSLYLLSRILFEYYKVPTIILIDEYDVPLENAFFRGFYDEMLVFIRTLFETGLKTNDYLEFAVLTGCLRISKESVFTGLNNFAVFSMYNVPYIDKFGFTEVSVRNMVQYYDLGNDVLDHMKKWYDGYHFNDIEVYNPWSVLNAVKVANHDKERGLLSEKNYLMPFWSNTSNNDVVGYLLKHADDTTNGFIDVLLDGGSVRMTIKQDITFGDLRDLKTGLWSFLYYTGYLTPHSVKVINGEIIADLKIPNEEVKLIFHKQIDAWTAEVIEDSKLDLVYKAITDGDVGMLSEELTKILIKIISYNDYRESFYHGFLTGILSGMPEYAMKSNDESGYGRSDVILKHIEGRRAIIFEFKYAKDEFQMAARAEEALNQIERMKYDSNLVNENFTEITKYGIAFNRKKCYIIKASQS